MINDKIINLYSRKKYLFLGIFSCILLFFLIFLPLLMVIETSFKNQNGYFSFDSWTKLINEDNLIAINNSLLLGFCVSLLSSLIALPCAYIMSRSRLRKIWWLDIVLMIPFMIPPYINSMGWMEFMGRNGILYRLNPIFEPLCNSFFSFFGMVFIMSLHTFPFLMTIMKNAFLNLPKSLDDACKIYSKNKFKNLIKIYAPILLPNFAIGLFLVFVKALAEYGTPATFGLKINYVVFSTLITDYMQVAPIDFSLASSLATILLSVCLILWLLQMLITNKKVYFMKKEKVSEPKENIFLSIFYGFILLLIFSISTLIPFYSIFTCSIKKISYYGFSKDNITFEYYSSLFNDDTGFGTGLNAIKNSFFIGIVSGIIILVLGILITIFIIRNKRKKISKIMEFIATLPQMVPNIVLGIGLIMLYSSIRRYIPIYRTVLMLIIGYVIIFLPTMISYIKNSLIQVPNSLFEAGDVYSKSQFKVNIRIVLPLALKGAFYGFIMVFIVSLRELVTAKLLQPASFYTMSLYIDYQYQQGNQQAAMALAVVSIFLTLIILIPLECFMNYKTKKGQI